MSEEHDSLRRLPDHLRSHVMTLKGGKLYLPAADRISWFREERPEWGILTDLVEGGHESGYATIKATVYNAEGRPIASDYKTESKQDFPAGWVEKAATGAISRALALAGFGTQFMGLDEQEIPAQHPTPNTQHPTPPAAQRPIWAGPGQCPHCHAPEGKPHSARCPENDKLPGMENAGRRDRTADAIAQ